MSDQTPWLTLGDQLRTARRREWLSQHDVARRLGITQAAYCHIERGRVRPRLTKLRQLAEVLHLPMTQLLPLAEYEPDAFVKSVAMELAVG